MKEERAYPREPVCVHCGGGRFEYLFPIVDTRGDQRQTFVRCVDCGLARGWSPDARKSPGAFESYQHRTDPVLLRLKAWLTFGPDRTNMDRIEGFAPMGSLLDVGCGDGRLLEMARDRGWRVAGCEPDPAMVEELRRRGEMHIHAGDLSSLPSPEAPYDVVVCRYSMEQFADPARELARIRRLLTPSGLLVVNVPNLDALQARLFGRRWFQLRIPEHVHHFTPRTLRALVEGAGFSVVQLDTPLTPVDLVGVAASLFPSVDPVRIRQYGSFGVWWRRGLFTAVATLALAPSAVASAIGIGGTIRLIARNSTGSTP